MPFQKGNKLAVGRKTATHTIKTEAMKAQLVHLTYNNFKDVKKFFREGLKNQTKDIILDLLNRVLGKAPETIDASITNRTLIISLQGEIKKIAENKDIIKLNDNREQSMLSVSSEVLPERLRTAVFNDGRPDRDI